MSIDRDNFGLRKHGELANVGLRSLHPKNGNVQPSLVPQNGRSSASDVVGIICLSMRQVHQHKASHHLV